MRLTDSDRDLLLISYAAELAQRRRGRGLRLTQPEAIAIITAFVLEGARDGRDPDELVTAACEVLDRDDVLPGIDSLIESVEVTATFADGARWVIVPWPIR